MITGIRSDLPGQITAQATENICDSPTGRILFVPQGTRIIGQYDNAVQFGQRRVLLVWNRLIFPNGRTFSERFLRKVGLAPMEYVMRWRMALAKDMLRREDPPLETVAAAIGYESASAFSTAFPREVGCPPSHFARA